MKWDGKDGMKQGILKGLAFLPKTRIGITNKNKPYLTKHQLDKWDGITPPTGLTAELRSAPVALRTTTLPEPILYEKDGWGIYGTYSEDCLPGGAVETRRDGHTLTHIGCDCDYPNWSMAQYIWSSSFNEKFSCTECHAVLNIEAYEEFCKVYNFINNLPFPSKI